MLEGKVVVAPDVSIRLQAGLRRHDRVGADVMVPRHPVNWDGRIKLTGNAQYFGTFVSAIGVVDHVTADHHESGLRPIGVRNCLFERGYLGFKAIERCDTANLHATTRHIRNLLVRPTANARRHTELGVSHLEEF